MTQKLVTFNKAIEDYIMQVSGNLRDKKLLDIGCGTGYYTHYFGASNEVIGVDLLSCVQKKYQNFQFRQADATQLPFRAKTFDTAVSFDVIEHIEKDQAMVKEAYRVLKDGGQLIIGTPNRDRLVHLLLKIIQRPVKYPLYMGSYDDLGDMIHVREYTKTELQDLLKNAGFRRVEIIPFWLGITTLGLGLLVIPKFLQQFSQYLFARGYK